MTAYHSSHQNLFKMKSMLFKIFVAALLPASLFVQACYHHSDIVSIPEINGSLDSVRVQEETGAVTIRTATAFSGNNLSYSLEPALTGVSIHAGTGDITINTHTAVRQVKTSITVHATNSAGSATQSFHLTVGPQLGVAIPFEYLRQKSDTEVSGIFNDMFSKNMVYVRCDLRWRLIEATKGTFVFNDFGRLARLAEQAGLKVIWILNSGPERARLPGVNASGPTNAGDYARFAEAAARYFTSNGLNVHHWEIWNEPNLPTFWDTNFLKDPAQLNSSAVYLADMHIAAYNAIKAVDPAATVITAGLSSVPATERKSSNNNVYVNPTDWLTAMYSVPGFSNTVDAIGIHPYVHPLSVLGTQGWNGVKMMRVSMHNFLVSKGHGDKKVWMTEFGAPTKGERNPVSEETQRDYLVDLFDLAAGTTWAGPIIWYTWFDLGASGQGGANNAENWFGAHGDVNSGYAPKPVVEIMKSIKRGQN